MHILENILERECILCGAFHSIFTDCETAKQRAAEAEDKIAEQEIEQSLLEKYDKEK